MDITLNELKIIADTRGFNINLVEKDYLVTYLLYLMKDIKGMHFKGGTAINKILLHHARLSEDLDFTLTHGIKEVEQEIRDKLKGTIFSKITHDKRVDRFIRLVVHYKLFHDEGTIFIDLNERAKLLKEPMQQAIHHFYPDHLPEFSISTLSTDELIAEKMAAAIGRNRPRDHFDLYKIISLQIPIDLGIVKKKCSESGDEFNIIKIFDNADKLKRRWDEDLAPLIGEKITFQEVMKTLAKHFRLKECKEKLRNKVKKE